MTCRLCSTEQPLDSHGRCRGCVLTLETVAAKLSDIDELVRDALRAGVTVEQVRVTVEWAATDRRGELPDGEMGRVEFGTWVVVPESEWLEIDPIDFAATEAA